MRAALGAGPEPPPSIGRAARGQWQPLGFRLGDGLRRDEQAVPRCLVVEGAGGGGDEKELQEGEEWVYICSRRISLAFRGGFGPGLFDPCVGARRRAKAAAAVLVVLCPFTASRTGPL